MDHVSFRGIPPRVSVPLWEQPIIPSELRDRKDYLGTRLRGFLGQPPERRSERSSAWVSGGSSTEWA